MTDTDLSNLEWRALEASVAYRLAQQALRPYPVGTNYEKLKEMMLAEVSARSEWEVATDALIEAREAREDV